MVLGDIIKNAVEGLGIKESEVCGLFESVLEGVLDMDSAIYTAVSRASSEEPYWVYVAGRLLMFKSQIDVYNNRLFDDVYSYCDAWKYDEIKSFRPNKYRSEFDSLDWEFAVKCMNEIKPERDFLYDYAGANILVERYLDRDKRGRLVELPQEMYMVTAICLGYNEDEEDKVNLTNIKKIYDLLSLRQVSLATPMLANLRFKNKNVASCFITRAGDSIDEIFNTVHSIAKVSKSGGGIGVHLSRIRAKGSSVCGTPNASGGVVPWIRIMNDTAVAVNQQGKRAGAVTVALDTWHNDIEHFLELQTENGDQRGKAYDVYPQICVSDEFMRRVEEGLPWTTFCPYEVLSVKGIDFTALYGDEFTSAYRMIESDCEDLRIKKVYTSARDLFKQVLKVQVETGMPYIFFRDTVNEANLNKNKGIIDCGNLCMESFSAMSDETDHTCNLVSVNVAEFDCYKDIQSASIWSSIILNSALKLGVAPIEKAKAHNDSVRAIGVGIVGFADYLANKGIKYSNSIDEVRKVTASVMLGTISGSIASSYYYGVSANGVDIQEIDKKLVECFDVLGDDTISLLGGLRVLLKEGIANGEFTAIAPNSSTSILMGSSASLLPIYDTFFVEKNSKGAVPRVAKFYDKKWYYETMKNIDQKKYIDIIAEAQKFVTQGISMELLFNLNEGLTAKDIYDTILYAWHKKCKSVYYIRSVQKDITKECSSCAN